MLVHAATFNAEGGYGRLARSVVSALNEIDGPNMIISDDELPEDLKIYRGNGNPALTISTPENRIKAPVHFTMFESTAVPIEFVEALNKRRLILVPCSQNLEAFQKSGVKPTIEVVHPYIAPCYTIPPVAPFTFIHISADNGIPERKRAADVVRAFCKAFPTQDNVRLIIKKSPQCSKIPCFDSRVRFVYENLPMDELKRLIRLAHVGVFSTGQESWGYPHADLMASGRPFIAPLFGGPSDFADETCAFGVDYRMVKTPLSLFKQVGQCPRVGIIELSRVMRFCYENPHEVILRGAVAYKRMLGFSKARMVSKLSFLLYEDPKI